MNRMRGTLCMGSRLALLALLLSCLSPGPRQAPEQPTAFADLFQSSVGEPSIVIWKSQYTLTLYKGGSPFKTYRAVFGKGYAGGDKQRQGDKRTPEGEFYICTMNHSKRFYKFMGLSYPSSKHAAVALERGIITPQEYEEIDLAIRERRMPPWETRLGGAVGIHGRTLEFPDRPTAGASRNWTDGCIALANVDVDELFSVVSLGTPVIILP